MMPRLYFHTHLTYKYYWIKYFKLAFQKTWALWLLYMLGDSTKNNIQFLPSTQDFLVCKAFLHI